MLHKGQWWLLILALVCIAAGYLLLSAQRLSWGPLLLVLGYCVLLPLFLWVTFQRGDGQPAGTSEQDPGGRERRIRVGE